MSDYDRYEYECRDKRENTLPEGIIMYAISDPCKGIKDPCKNGGVCIGIDANGDVSCLCPKEYKTQFCEQSNI